MLWWMREHSIRDDGILIEKSQRRALNITITGIALVFHSL
jgi:hypothetical protein